MMTRNEKETAIKAIKTILLEGNGSFGTYLARMDDTDAIVITADPYADAICCTAQIEDMLTPDEQKALSPETADAIASRILATINELLG